MVDTVIDGPGAQRIERLQPGTRVDVRDHFVGNWGRGFEVVEVLDTGVRLRRLSDGSVLPEVFGFDDVRAERRRQGLWWA